MKITTAAVFGLGYVLGSKAGRERYAQIVHVVERASQQLEEFSSRHPPDRASQTGRSLGAR